MASIIPVNLNTVTLFTNKLAYFLDLMNIIGSCYLISFFPSSFFLSSYFCSLHALCMTIIFLFTKNLFFFLRFCLSCFLGWAKIILCFACIHDLYKRMHLGYCNRFLNDEFNIASILGNHE